MGGRCTGGFPAMTSILFLLLSLHIAKPTPSPPSAHEYEQLPSGGYVVRKVQQPFQISMDLSADAMRESADTLSKIGREDLAYRSRATSARLSAATTGRSAWYDGSTWCITHPPNTGTTATQSQREPEVTPPWLSSASNIDDAVKGYALHHGRVRAEGRETAQFLVYRPSHHGEGWGNRAMALTSVVAWGMVSGRTVLVEWPSAYPLSDIIQPPFDWDMGPWRSIVGSRGSLDVTDPAQLTRDIMSSGPDGIHTIRFSSYSSFWGAIMRHPGKGYAALRDLCSASIARAPRHLGGAEFAMFGCVARAVLRPGAGISEGAGGSLVKEAISGSGPLLGMHVRFGSIHTSNYQMMRQDDLSQMFHCAALTLSRMGAGAKIFLAADTEAVRGYARKLLGDRVIYQDCAVAHTGEHHAIKGHDAVTADGRPRDREALLCAMRDWFMLAFSSQWVLSNQSSYGYSASAWGFPPLTAGTPITVSAGGRECTQGVWGGHMCREKTC